MPTRTQRRALARAAALLAACGCAYFLWPRHPPDPTAPASPALGIRVEPATAAAGGGAGGGEALQSAQARIAELEATLLRLRASKSQARLPALPPPTKAPLPPPLAQGGAGGAATSRWRELEQLHAAWDIYLINLPRRQDKLSCVLQDFGRVGLEARVIPGVDGSKLDVDELDMMNRQRKSRPGHRGTPARPLADLIPTWPLTQRRGCAQGACTRTWSSCCTASAAPTAWPLATTPPPSRSYSATWPGRRRGRRRSTCG